MKLSIRRYLTLIFLCLAVVPILVLGTILAGQSFSAQYQEALLSEHQVSAQVAAGADAFIQTLKGQLQTAGQLLKLRGISWEEQNAVLLNLQSLQPAFQDLAFLDSSGREQARVAEQAVIPAAELANRAGAIAFTTAQKGEVYYSGLHFEGGTGQSFLTMAVPIDGPDATPAGVLIAEVRLTEIWALVAKQQVGPGETLYIIDDSNNVVVHEDGAAVHRETGFALPATEGRHIGINDKPVILAFERLALGSHTLFVVTEKDERVALRPAVNGIWLIALLIAVAVVVAGGAGLWALRRIVRPIEGLAAAAEAVGAGDLERTVPADRRDELGVLGQAFNTMTARLRAQVTSLEQRIATEQAMVHKYASYMAEIAQGKLAARLAFEEGPATDDPLFQLGHDLNNTAASLQEMAAQIRSTADSLGNASLGVLAATNQQSAGSSQQSAAITEISVTIDQVRSIARQTSERARSVAELAQQTAAVSDAGQTAIVDAAAGMSRIKDRVEVIAGNVLSLSEQSKAIGQIMATIGEIAAQSNILALNAAVEAARAGATGRGFAVVAGEVRALAERSRSATEQVREILSEIQRGVNTAVMATEEGTKEADVGVELVGNAGEAIHRLAEDVTVSVQAAIQISAAAEQQLTGMEQIAQAIQNIQEVTTESLSQVRHSEQAAAEMNRLAGKMNEAVERYTF